MKTVPRLFIVIASLAAAAHAQENPLSPSTPSSTPPKNPLERDTPTPAPVAPAASAPIVLKMATVSDPGSGNMPSHTILAPAGWKVEGSAWWPPPNMFNILPTQDIKVIAPDGRMVHVSPSIAASDYRPSQMAMRQLGAKRSPENSVENGLPVIYLPDDLEQWKSFLENKSFRTSIPQATNLRMDSVVVVPELTKILAAQLAPLRQMQEQTNRMGGGIHGSCDGVVLAGTCFYELDGKQWEHLIIFGVSWTMTDMEVGRQISWSIEPCVSYRAEVGQLEANMPLLMSIANSVRMTPQWSQMKSDHMAKMNQIAAKGAADRSAIIAQSNREISKIITEGYNDRQASQDRSHYNFIKAIRGVEDYTEGNGSSPVQLPNNYSHIYSNGNGEYIMTNDSLYNPNTDTNVNNRTWNPMKPAG